MNSEKDKTLEIFGENVKYFRLQKNFTIKELSENTGIREKYLEQIEKGTAIGMSITQLFRIAFALNVNPRDLVRGL